MSDMGMAAAGIGTSCSTFKGDVAVASDAEALYTEVMARHGRLDTVIANAGAGYHSPLGAITEEEFDQTFSTNAKGVLFTVQAALPFLPSGGTVVIIGSTGSINPPREMSMYGGAKAARLRPQLDPGHEGVRDPHQRAQPRSGRHGVTAQRPRQGTGSRPRPE
jgi:NAD(P)-dependent dehydrogenase (short-subunit alcohol dehydrogenase family)